MLNYAILVIIMQKTRLAQKCQIEPFCTKVAKCHLPFTDSIVLLKQKRSNVMIAKPAKTLITSFNNNTPLVEFNPGKHPVKV